MRIARHLLDEIVDHARRDAPDECCGVIGVRDGQATSVHALENLAHSPLKFVIGADLIGAMDEIEGVGDELGAIYHSHTRTAPYPSPTDANFSVNWPGVEWLIVGLDAGGAVEVKSYLIEGGRIEEVPVEVAG